MNAPDRPLLTNEMALVQVLRSGRQADPDGVEVRISRQAVEEAANEIDDLRAQLREWVKANGPGGWIDDLRQRHSSEPGAVGQEPVRPYAWFRIEAGEVIFAQGDWPPPEPDDTAWAPLYTAAARSKFDLAFDVMRQMQAEDMDTMQSVHFGYVLRVERGASRDASPPYHVDATGMTREPPHCPTCDCGTPADLVGALQDVVHTDPGPVRAGKAVKPRVSPGQDIVDLLEDRGDELSMRAARHIRLKRQSADAWREQALKAGRLSLERPEVSSESVNRHRCMRCNAPYSTIQMLDAHEESCDGKRTE